MVLGAVRTIIVPGNFAWLFGSLLVVGWVEIVVAGAIRSVKHIADYRKKKKAKKEAYKIRQAETLAKRKAETNATAESTATNKASFVKTSKPASSANFSLTPFLAIGAVIVGAILLKKR